MIQKTPPASHGLSCPCCASLQLRTLETRAIKNGARRRRRCVECGARFSTIETLKSIDHD